MRYLEMKKMVLPILLACLMVLLAGCESTTQEHIEDDVQFEIIPSAATYNYEVIRNREIKKPTGIAITDTNILVSDAEKHCIHVLNLDGTYISSFGSIGMGNGSFFRPAGLAWQDNKLYVVDSRNCRVQVFAEDFSFVKSYALTKIDKDEPYNHIAVSSDGEIYVTATTGISQYAHIYHIHPQDAYQSLIGNNIMGIVCNSDEGILFAENKEIHHEADTVVQRTGHNKLFSIAGEEMREIRELPYKYCPMDMMYRDGFLYTFSFRYNMLDKYTPEGNYVETLLSLPDEYEPYKFFAMAYNEKDSSFYLTYPGKGCILRIYQTNNEE